MSIDPDLRKEHGGPGGRYILSAKGAEAEITYITVSPGLIRADHTGVPDAMRGTGAGLRLVTYMVTDARANGFHIIPQCPFIAAMRLRHPEWADVFADPGITP